ncbi:integration host factor subunit alpha [Dethiosulfatarculus sandiegensis]|uniref:Integration host factor subunit alpha n=1 Tax=Dethiosulfatarculus sandiegensis TaxID=1429043 RepID=A0A0D2J4U0_9BACT|nr:integration host factor subunit alpha [Dethiosulfatarculus sandiegensis]
MTKADIIAQVYAKGQLSKNEAVDAVERALELIKHALASGDEVLISGFGKWSVRAKSQRRGRNPQTGDPLILPSRKVVTFRPSRVLKANIQGSDGEPGPAGEKDDESKENANGQALRPGYF